MVHVPHRFAIDSVRDNVAFLVVDGSQGLTRQDYILRTTVGFARFQRSQQITERRVDQNQPT